jgi:hypothetical protein
MIGIERTETAKAGIHDPKLILLVPGQFVNIDVAGDVDAPGKITAIVFTRRLQLLRHGRLVAVVPHRVGAANRQPQRIGSNPHGLGKAAEMGVDDALVVADQNNLAGLVGGDDQTDP